MLKKIIVSISVILLIAFVSIVFSQGRNKFPQLRLQPDVKIQKQIPPPENEFENIIDALNSKNISALAQYFSSQVYLSLRTGEKGYYSNNQSFYLLDKFFSIYNPMGFQTTNRVMTGFYPYLSGKLFCKIRGIVEAYQTYISLNWNGSRWEITQITIN